MNALTLGRQCDQPTGPTAPAQLKTQLLSSNEEFAELGNEWNALLNDSRSRNIFLTWEWVWTWWQTFGDGDRPWVLVVREGENGRLMGVAPFVLRKLPFSRGPCRELSLMGTSVSSGDHLDVICRSGSETAVVARIAEVLAEHRHQWDILTLDRMASDSALLDVLRAESAGPAMAWESICPFVRVPDRWELLHASLTKNMRRNLRKCVNHLERKAGGTVEYSRVRTVEEVPAAMEELFRLHQELWASRGERGCFCNPAIRRFHQQVAAKFAANDWLRLYLLRAAGRTIAAEYDFRYGSTVCMFQSGYDRQWASCSPGAILTGHAIRSAIEEGATEVDFLRGEEPYKALWTREARKDLRLRLATTSLGSLVVLAYRVLYATRCRIRRWRGAGRRLACSPAHFTEPVPTSVPCAIDCK